jgi:ATP-dependent helicase HepA
MSNAIFQPAVGQRWISDTESELGLGVVIELDGRSVTILFPKSEETRAYALQNAPLSRIKFAVDEIIYDINQVPYKVIEIEEVRGLLRYITINQNTQEQVTLNETRLSADIHLAKPQERLLAAQLDSPELYNLRIQAVLQDEKLNQSSIRGLIGPRLGKIPHQFYIAHEVGNRPQPRVLLGDEVGLGKTIEAGLIIHQQLQTSRAHRILILVPENLQYQWLVEMRRRFNLNAALFDLQRCASIKEADETQNPFETEQIVLMSQELAVDHPDIAENLLATEWDLLVVDEAHHLEWTPEEASADYELVEALAKKTPGVLLLTATPEHLGVASHFARLRLLDPARYHNLEQFIENENNYADIANVANDLLSDKKLTKKAIAVLAEKLPTELMNDLNIAENRLKALEALLDRHGVGRVLFRNTREAIGGFPSRECFPAPLESNYTEEPSDIYEALYPETYADNNWIDNDARVEWLLHLIKKLKREKILLICRSSPVALELEEYLQLKQGVRTSVFHEGMTLLERDRAAAYFADEDNGAQILLCSEIGSEGRNFQFAHHLVLFDLPLDPELLEQRIGRLDRIGQTETIKLHVPYFKNTPQEKLFRWYHEGLDAIENISPTARTLLDEHRKELSAHIKASNDEGFTDFLKKIKARKQELLKELDKGRDKLIEMNSCRKEIAQELLDELEKTENDPSLSDFMERCWSAFGVDQEEQMETHLHIIRPGDHQLLEGFPGLDPDGMTVTFSRQYALSREDVSFLTWEHPMTLGLLDIFKTQEYGNANVALIKNKAIKPGTVLLEMFFHLETIAPKFLNVESSFPSQIIRVLLDEKGNDLSANVSHDILTKQLQSLDKSVARRVVKGSQELLETLLSKSSHIAQAKLPELVNIALHKWQEQKGAEIQRLQYLASINEAINPKEIKLLEKEQTMGAEAISAMRAVAHAVRLIVAA